MLGNRSVYNNGWVAATTPVTLPWELSTKTAFMVSFVTANIGQPYADGFRIGPAMDATVALGCSLQHRVFLCGWVRAAFPLFVASGRGLSKAEAPLR